MRLVVPHTICLKSLVDIILELCPETWFFLSKISLAAMIWEYGKCSNSGIFGPGGLFASRYSANKM
jgi:hypothetical protein